MRRRLALIVALTALCRLPLAGQGAPPALLLVRVGDTTGAPLPGAELVLLKAKEAVLQATTDASGRHTFVFSPENARYQLIVRKVGYIQTTRLVSAMPGETFTVKLALGQLPPALIALDTVRVTDTRTRSRNYFIDSNEIARSSRSLIDAWDVVRKLRPDMIVDKDRCPGEGLKYIWVNGQRLAAEDVPAPPPPPPPRRSSAGRGARGGSSGRPLPAAPVSAQPAEPGSVLAMINPEHIAEVRYLNCWDTSMPGVGGQRALFITLKPGISFDRKRGSYVDSTVTPPPEYSPHPVPRR